VKCIVGGCPTQPAKAINLGVTWPDGRGRYTITCLEHVDKVVSYQASMGIAAQVLELDQATIVGTCAAAWRSHACSGPDDHEGNHVCDRDCRDTPSTEDKVYNWVTGEDCARTGGVPE
jgi:hypothetical protein